MKSSLIWKLLSEHSLLLMFPLMKTFAIIGILLINFYSTKNYLVEVGDERSEEYDLEESSEEDLEDLMEVSSEDIGQGNFWEL